MNIDFNTSCSSSSLSSKRAESFDFDFLAGFFFSTFVFWNKRIHLVIKGNNLSNALFRNNRKHVKISLYNWKTFNFSYLSPLTVTMIWVWVPTWAKINSKIFLIILLLFWSFLLWYSQILPLVCYKVIMCCSSGYDFMAFRSWNRRAFLYIVCDRCRVGFSSGIGFGFDCNLLM